MTRVKVCGLTSLADALAAAEAGADLLGFIFAPGPRRVAPEAAAAIWPRLPPGVAKVAVFRDQAFAEVERLLALLRPDYAQFHGNEPPGFCRVFGVPVIRALPARAPADLAVAEAFIDAAEMFLIDVPKGEDGTLPEDVARMAVHLPKPVLLAGGLSPANVAEVVERFGPFGVDVARGVEASPGVKDRAKVREFVARAKAASRT